MTDDIEPMSAAAFTTQLEALGLRQADLSRILQHEPTTVNRWAKGHRPVPMSVALLLIAWGTYPKLIPGREKKSAAA